MSEQPPQQSGDPRGADRDHAAAIPAQLTRLVGRDREIAELRGLAAASRLLTLTGAGGSGKTRLALEVARLAAAEGRVAWVELAPLVDPDHLADHVATALGVRQDGTSSAEEALAGFLRERSMLLVLDNCEHVVEASARLGEFLLRRCPGLRVLATSREPLGISGEQSWLVPLLSLPDAARTPGADDVGQSAAVQLFVERARDVLPSFALTEANAPAIARICRRVDGLPLAIELAAARVRMLGPEQIAERLTEGFRLLDGSGRASLPRHRTLRAAMEWSYRLLDDREAVLLQRLSVLAGDWSLEAAESICADGDVAAADVLDLLAALVDKSLVIVRESEGTARYALLETIRQYAAERLETGGAVTVFRARHARFFAALVAAAEPDFVTVRRPAAVERVARELDNVRAALFWTREHDPALHLRLAGMLVWLWYSLGLWTEARRWLEEALALPEAAAAPQRERAAALFGVGAFASLQAEAAAARDWLEASLAAARAAGDERLAAYASNYLAMAYIQQGLPEGASHAHDALLWFRDAGDLYGYRLALLLDATLHLANGRIADALAAAEEGVAVARRFGLDRELGISLQVLGGVALQSGDLDRADALIRESLARLRADPQPLFTSRGLELLGLIACRRGDPVLGARFFGAAAAERELIGAGLWRLDRERLAPFVDAARQAAGAEAFDAAWGNGRRGGLLGVASLALAPAPRPGAALESKAAAEPPTSHPALSVRALGPLEIHRNGELLHPEDWRSGKPVELLLYLLTHTEGRTRDQLGLVFWPDASAAQVKNNFHVTLHHLRRMLGGTEWIVFEKDRYRVNWALGVELDALVFEREMTEALRGYAAAKPAARAAREARMRAALALYRGDFLADAAVGDWHMDLRDRLRVLWTDGMRALGDAFMDAERYAEAGETYRRLLQREEIDEAAHRGLMTCLARLGERAQALRVYERLTTTLRSELEAEPEAETTALFDRVRRAERV